jgi:hypothetical protein
MNPNYRLPNIRALLTAGFTVKELRRFCYDTPEFRAVYDQLAANTGKAELIDRLLEHAERKDLLDILLAWAEAESPAKYAQHQPYELSAITSPPPAPSASSSAMPPPTSPLCVTFTTA